MEEVRRVLRAKIRDYEQARAAAAPGAEVELESRLRFSGPELFQLLRTVKPGPQVELALESGIIENLRYSGPRHARYASLYRRVLVRSAAKPAWGAPAAAATAYEEKEARGTTAHLIGKRPWKVQVAAERAVTPFTPGDDVRAFVRARVSAPWPLAEEPAKGEGPAAWRLDAALVWRTQGSAGARQLPAMQREFLDPLRAAAQQGWEQFLGALSRFAESDRYAADVELEWRRAAPPAPEDFSAVDAVYARVVSVRDRRSEFNVLLDQMARRLYPSNGNFAAQKARLGLKGILPNPESFSLGRYYELGGGAPLSGWLVGLKLDGAHCLVYAKHTLAVLLDPGRVVHVPLAEGGRPLTVVEGELVQRPAAPPAAPAVGAPAEGASVEGAPAEGAAESDVDWVTHRVHVFDVLVLEGKSLLTVPPQERVKHIAGAVTALRRASAGGRGALPVDWVVAKCPQVLEEGQEERIIRGLWPAPPGVGADGLILTAPETGRVPYTRTRHYKWKPPEENTIDFLVRAVPEECQLGALKPPAGFRGTTYALFLTGNCQVYRARNYEQLPHYAKIVSSAELKAYEEACGESGAGVRRNFPLHFAPPDLPDAGVWFAPEGAPGGAGELSGEICELLACFDREWTPSAPLTRPRWELRRVRADRRQLPNYYGNYVLIAEETWLNRRVPFPVSALWSRPSDAYFRAVKDPRYAAGTGFGSMVKAALFSRLTGPVHVELAAGRGADLRRVYDLGAAQVLMVDCDAAALLLLYERVKSRAEKAKRLPGAAPRVSFALADLTESPEKLAAIVRELRFPPATSASCQFALHYFCGSPGSLANFAGSCQALLKPGGRIVLTYPDGGVIFDLLAQHAGHFLTEENGQPKYELKQLWKGATLANTGQKVAVRLPFRSTAELAEEFLVNHEYFLGVMAKHGFACVESGLFSDFFREFELQQATLAATLSAADREYFFTYRYTVLERRAEKAGV